MKHLSVLIKPASSLCNMRCAYCFYSDVSSLREVASYGLMTDDAMQKVIDSIFTDLADGDHLAIAFQGGEPTLAGLGFYERFTAYAASRARRIHVSYSIQTNGLLIDEAWAAFFKQHGFLVGLSLDGPVAFHDANRLDETRRGTHARAAKAWRVLASHEVPANVLCVLTADLARQPDNVMDHFLEEGIGHVQFIPCLGPLQGKADPHALTPELFASFYDRIFQRWLHAVRSGQDLHIQLIDALIELLATGHETVCGLKGQCRLQMVVEADGSVYPCDFYVLDQYRMGSLTNMPLSALRAAPAALEFLSQRPDPPALCRSCAYAPICRGGCRRMQHAMYLDQTKTFCGWRSFLDLHYPTLRSIARQII